MNVLFLCTHSSVRSMLAEAPLNAMGHGRFHAYSAGGSPRENRKPHPLGLQVLQKAGISIEGLRSKSWDEFATPDEEKPEKAVLQTTARELPKD